MVGRLTRQTPIARSKHRLLQWGGNQRHCGDHNKTRPPGHLAGKQLEDDIMKKSDQFRAEIVRRGFLTEMECEWKGQPHKRNTLEKIQLKEKRRGLRLYTMEGYRKDSVYFQRFVYLAGIDNGVYWAIRCPSTVETIDEAIAPFKWL